VSSVSDSRQTARPGQTENGLKVSPPWRYWLPDHWLLPNRWLLPNLSCRSRKLPEPRRSSAYPIGYTSHLNPYPIG